MDNDESILEQEPENIESFEVDRLKLYSLLCGKTKTETGYETNTLSSVSVYDYGGEKPLCIDEELCGNTEIQIYNNGGCTVVELYFEEMERYDAVRHMCMDYMSNLQNEDYENCLLSLVMIPMHVPYITVIMNNLAYADGYCFGKTYKLILAFNDDTSRAVFSSDINAEDISAELERELNFEIEEAESRILEMEKELQSNDFEDFLKNSDEETQETQDFDLFGKNIKSGSETLSNR